MAATKREYRRTERAFSVQVASKGTVHHATTYDLSLGGIGVRNCAKLKIGEPVKLFVIIQEHLFTSNTLVLLNAIPVWQEGDAVGLRFVNVPPDVKQCLSTVTSL